ncbi:MAG: O-antigen ligase family protein [Myxococcota bacterium]
MSDLPDDRRGRRRRRRRSLEKHRQQRRLERVSVYPFLGVLGVAPLLFGGVFPWTIAILAPVAVVVSIGVFGTFRRHASLHQRSALGIGLLFALLWTGLQLVPIPFGLLEALSERSAAIQRDAAYLFDRVPEVGTISVAPGATMAEAVKWGALGSVIIAAWVASAAGYRKPLRIAVACSALGAGLVALGHVALDLDAVYGTYEPRYANPRLLGPLMNDNHLGGFSAFGSILLVSLGLDRSERPRRYVWWFLAGVLACVAIFSLSRGALLVLAVGALLIGVFLVFGIHRFRQPVEPRRREAAIALLFAVLAVAGTSVYLGADVLLRRLGGEGTEKFALAGEALSVVALYPITGVGRGGFSAAFAELYGSDTRFEYPENIAIQWVAEWGLVPGLILLGVFFVPVLQRFFRLPNLATAGALAALIAIVCQNVVDFSLELLGLALPIGALLATCVAPFDEAEFERRRRRRRSSKGVGRNEGPDEEQAPDRPESVVSVRRAGGLVLAGATGVVLLFAWRVPEYSVRELERSLEASGDDSAEERTAVLARAVEHHPAEPTFPLIAAGHALKHRDPATLRYLNRAMVSAPGWASPHVLAAEWLLSEGRVGQALLEVREAADRDPGAPVRTACRILVHRGEAADLSSMVPSSANGTTFLEHLAQCRDLPPRLVSAVDERLIGRAPDHVGVRLRHVHRLLDSNPSRAAEIAAEVVRDEPQSVRAYLLWGRALAASGAPGEAIQALEEGESAVADPGRLIRERAQLRSRAGEVEEMRNAIAALRATVAGQPRALAEVHAFRGRLERNSGNLGAAVAAYEDAFDLDPKPAYLEAVARLADDLGDTAQAASAYTRLRALDPHNPRYQQALDSLVSPTQNRP